jgi:23S rRNA (cytidine1920-2'-O)/16S rRNA (cytidine1409-2'-O)-methyltransferase
LKRPAASPGGPGAADPPERLDAALVQRGLVESRARAQALIRAGMVRVDGQPAQRADERVRAGDEVALLQPSRYVGRGGDKLHGALEDLAVDPAGRVCLDAGASTGGFTDVLLQQGAQLVYAVDVGYGQLDWRLRQDKRVVVMERTNIRYLTGVGSTAPDLVVADLSFISLRKVVPALVRLLTPGADMVLLVKPQFELGPGRVGKGGIVRAEEDRESAVTGFIEWATGEGLTYLARAESRVRGARGNQETFVHLRTKGAG